ATGAAAPPPGSRPRTPPLRDPRVYLPLMEASSRRPRVFSGVQPTGVLHIGSYVGALRQWVAGQDERDNIFCVVDLHALTIPEAIDPHHLRERVPSTAALVLAAGIDPAKRIVLEQSDVRVQRVLARLLGRAQ